MRTNFSKFLKIFFVLDLLLLYKHGIAEEIQPINGFHGEERDALLALKAGLINKSFLDQNWTSIMCYMNQTPYWYGILCSNGRVTGIVLENMGLTGEISADVLSNLTELSVLSLKNNSISGNLMDFSNNQKMTEIDFSGNRFYGQLPSSLLRLNSLVSLQLQDNKLSGSILEFNQSSLKRFNASNNNFSGAIPNTTFLQSLDRLSFVGNQNLCGPPSSMPCISKNATFESDANSTDDSSNDSWKSRVVPILLIVNIICLVIFFFLFIIYFKKYRKLKNQLKENYSLEGDKEKEDEKNIEEGAGRGGIVEGEEKGKLVFMDVERSFELDDLLKASAEGLGKGNFGNCYKAMLENGPTVVVKRLRDLKPLTKEEFMEQIRAIAEMWHPNLLPFLAYYYSKDEKLLLYKFASNGNVYNRLHDGKGKPSRIPFRWSSRLAVARGVARGLEYLHLNIKSPNTIPHGNLKLSNVVIGENESVLVTDYGLASLIAVPLASQRMFAYKSPEYQSYKRASRKSDVWSYGCLLLELLTGRISADSAPQGAATNDANVVDICSYVHRAVREEWTAEIFDVEIAVQRSAVHGMLKLLQIAIRCCERSPEKRPEMSEVVREVENIAVVADSEDEEDFSSLTDDSISGTPSRLVSGGEDQGQR